MVSVDNLSGTATDVLYDYMEELRSIPAIKAVLDHERRRTGRSSAWSAAGMHAAMAFVEGWDEDEDEEEKEDAVEGEPTP
ncbi:hypothetical protein N0V83_010772 [Neocucurbitaria cava]|uniref:Uncharacterized protein n=1 Tax=Neocucurbitaria cava TaxID=798079 RepID=A0A9W9CH59_9PLEO|nr:hypothetical protein N0V83_010772 [Neocucurbitaria cava]